ncbi:Exocyst complex component 3 [Ilyodon furcidens]|uniref:Exocyst complex component 3 n=1 Tax=Ilyodon furcidens TaxID=33524 RepID=A0ABV0TVY1_9TELE
MFEQNLQVAAQIDGDFKEQVLKLCLKQMNSFLMRYREEVVAYKDEHLRDRQLPQCYIQYMIAIINNCQTFKESINSLKRKYSQSSDPFDSDAAIVRTLSEVVKEGCQFLLDEVFLDLEVRATGFKLNQFDCTVKSRNVFICSRNWLSLMMLDL